MRRILRKATPFIALAILVSFAPTAAEATPVALAPGTPNQGLVIPAGAETSNPGTLLASLVTPFVISKPVASITGTVISAVYRNAAGFLDFYYQITNSSSVVYNTDQGISGITGWNYGGYSTAVGYYDSASYFSGVFAAPSLTYPGTRPYTADRSADGNQVTLWFGPPWGSNKIHPGETSSILLVATNSTTFQAGVARVQNASFALVPSFAVPEPGTIVTALMGLAVLARARRRVKN